MSDYNVNKLSLNNKENLKKKSLLSKEKILTDLEFAKHKHLTLDIADKYQNFNIGKARDMQDCGRILFFNKQQHLQNSSQRLKLDQMYTCKDRFCPFCNWRRSRKLALQSYAILKQIESEQKVRFLFLTLTVRNPKTSDLRKTINEMMSGFNRLRGYKRVQNSSLGWMRALEVHPQKTDRDKMHPHFHVLLIVPPLYFQVGSPLYIPQKEWQQLWKKSMKLDYAPSVDIRAIKPKNDHSDALASVVAETCKYPVKSTDLSQLNDSQFELFVKQMFKVRNLGFGGIFKEYRQKLDLDDIEDGDLIHEGTDQEEHLWETIEKLRFDYKLGKYGLNYYQNDGAAS